MASEASKSSRYFDGAALDVLSNQSERILAASSIERRMVIDRNAPCEMRLSMRFTGRS